MKNFIALALILLFTIVACSPTATPTAPKPTARPTQVAATQAPATQAPAAQPTNTAVASSPTNTSAPPTQPAPTSTPTALAPFASPAPAPTIPPGLFALNLRIDPNPPTRGSDLAFYATFANTTANVQNVKWVVYIYKADSPKNAYGQTTPLQTSIQLGTNEFKSLGTWKYPLGGPCDYFSARVFTLDENNKATVVNLPSGQPYEKGFTVCPPPSEAPTPTPSQPTPVPTKGPGLFVMDIRIEPNPPTRGSELVFSPTFVNTSGTIQNMRWIVYIYRPGEAKSYGETTATLSAIPASIIEIPSLGFWKLPLGGGCENFVARVSFFDPNNKTYSFTDFDYQVFEEPFTVCPP